MALLRERRFRLPAGFWASTTLPWPLQVVIVAAAVAGNAVTAWRVLTLGPDGFGSVAEELTICVVDIAIWTFIAFAPGRAWILVILLHALLVITQTAPGSLLIEMLAMAGFLAYSARGPALALALGSTVAWTVVNPIYDPEAGSAFVSGYLATLVLPVAIGLSLRYMRCSRAEDRSVIEDFDRRTVALIQAQRDDLAREMHDIIAHDLTVIAMQSGAAAMQSPQGRQREAFEVIGDSARSALQDLRRLLHVMRGSGAAGEDPGTPAVIDLTVELADLAASLEDLHHRVRTSVSGDLERVPYGVRTTVSRVLREGTTNILKHSRAEADVDFRVVVGEDTITAEVENRGGTGVVGSVPARIGTSGFGIIGLRERALLLGGDFSSGPLEDGAWRLRAVLPLRAGS